jgi:hypothetical protein
MTEELEKTCYNCKYDDEDMEGTHCRHCIHNATEHFEPKEVVLSEQEIRMSDLISRSTLLKKLKELNWLDDTPLEDIINEQPTAYDVEKVVAELEEEKKYCSYHPKTKDEAINKAIDIVRKGGVE